MEYYGTLGPTCCEPTILKKMFDAGMTGIRLNLSHSSLEGSHAWIYHYFEAAKQTKGEKKLMIDLIGPELRIGYLEGDMGLSTGAHVVIGHGGILVPEEIMPHIRRDQEILLDDGKIKLIAERKISPRSWRCRIVCGGVLTARKSIALPGCNINNPTLTEADLKNLSLAKQYQVTDVMLPFVRNKEDLIILREALKQNNSEDIRIFAKIENMTGVEHLEELPTAPASVVADARPAEGPKLIQTGQLNWPIPVLTASGLVLVAVGAYLMERSKKREKNA